MIHCEADLWMILKTCSIGSGPVEAQKASAQFIFLAPCRAQKGQLAACDCQLPKQPSTLNDGMSHYFIPRYQLWDVWVWLLCLNFPLLLREQSSLPGSLPKDATGVFTVHNCPLSRRGEGSLYLPPILWSSIIISEDNCHPAANETWWVDSFCCV